MSVESFLQSLKGTVQPKNLMPMESRSKFRSPRNISEASQQNFAAFSYVANVDGKTTEKDLGGFMQLVQFSP